MNLIFIIALIMLNGCFNPDLTNVHFICTPSITSNDNCPPGQSCSDGGLCYAHYDMSVANCSDISSVNPSDAFACKSKLGKLTASQVCKVLGNYAPCKTTAAVNLKQCNSLQGFFISNNYGYRPSIAGTSMCNAGSPPNTFVAWGCGLISSGVQADGSCSGFALSVRTDTNGWQDVNPPDIDGVQSTSLNNGVLCCKS